MVLRLASNILVQRQCYHKFDNCVMMIFETGEHFETPGATRYLCDR